MQRHERRRDLSRQNVALLDKIWNVHLAKSLNKLLVVVVIVVVVEINAVDVRGDSFLLRRRRADLEPNDVVVGRPVPLSVTFLTLLSSV